MTKSLLGLALAWGLFGLGGCSSEDGVADNGSGGGGGSGGAGTSCDQPSDCGSGQFCSVSGKCLPEGKCSGDADCSSPKTCGKGSFSCLEPGACAETADCESGQSCNAAGQCEIGGGCGQNEFELTQIPPNLMILLDRSGSMSGDAGGNSRWNVAKSAIASVTTAYDAQIRFGLATYSSCTPGGCSAGSIVVAIADNNASAINAFLSNTIDEGSSNGQGMSGGKVQYLCNSGDPETSTGKSLSALVGEASLQDTIRQNAVILVTDGEETSECVTGCDGPCGAAALLQQSTQVKTYVIGLGINSSSVNQIAQSGGTSAAIPANNQQQLDAAFAQIAAAVATCEYTLSGTPPDPDKLFVFFNDDPGGVPNDPANGWSYDPVGNKLTFNGTACQDIKDGTVKDIDVVFGCGQPVPQ